MQLRFRSVFPSLCASIALAAMSTGAWAVDVAYIVGSLDLSNSGDVLITDFLTDRGYNLILIEEGEDAQTTLAASDDADLTIVSESVGSGSVNTEVKDSITPVITAEAFLYDDMGYTLEFGQEDLQTDITIVNPDHPLAAGLPAGDVSIFDNEAFLGYGVPGGDVTVIATSTDIPEWATLFVYEEGAVLDDGTDAPAMRIGIPHNGLTLDPFPEWTPEGEALFGVAVDYALGITVGETRLMAGDADQDLDFDQLDLVQVQVAAKYLSGQPATWGDGDWNGAPGGTPGAPPIGDGLFNQLDIIAALAPGHYLTGPYAANRLGSQAGDMVLAQTAVPEPASILLLTMAPVGLIAVWSPRTRRQTARLR